MSIYHMTGTGLGAGNETVKQNSSFTPVELAFILMLEGRQ